MKAALTLRILVLASSAAPPFVITLPRQVNFAISSMGTSTLRLLFHNYFETKMCIRDRCVCVCVCVLDRVDTPIEIYKLHRRGLYTDLYRWTFLVSPRPESFIKFASRNLRH